MYSTFKLFVAFSPALQCLSKIDCYYASISFYNAPQLNHQYRPRNVFSPAASHISALSVCRLSSPAMKDGRRLRGLVGSGVTDRARRIQPIPVQVPCFQNSHRQVGRPVASPGGFIFPAACCWKLRSHIFPSSVTAFLYGRDIHQRGVKPSPCVVRLGRRLAETITPAPVRRLSRAGQFSPHFSSRLSVPSAPFDSCICQPVYSVITPAWKSSYIVLHNIMWTGKRHAIQQTWQESNSRLLTASPTPPSYRHSPIIVRYTRPSQCDISYFVNLDRDHLTSSRSFRFSPSLIVWQLHFLPIKFPNFMASVTVSPRFLLPPSTVPKFLVLRLASEPKIS